MRWYVIVDIWKYHFIRIHENLVQHPSNYLSIYKSSKNLFENVCLSKHTSDRVLDFLKHFKAKYFVHNLKKRLFFFFVLWFKKYLFLIQYRMCCSVAKLVYLYCNILVLSILLCKKYSITESPGWFRAISCLN